MGTFAPTLQTHLTKVNFTLLSIHMQSRRYRFSSALCVGLIVLLFCSDLSFCSVPTRMKKVFFFHFWLDAFSFFFHFDRIIFNFPPEKFFFSTLGHNTTLNSYISWSSNIGTVRFKLGPLTILWSIYSASYIFYFMLPIFTRWGGVMRTKNDPSATQDGWKKISFPPKTKNSWVKDTQTWPNLQIQFNPTSYLVSFNWHATTTFWKIMKEILIFVLQHHTYQVSTWLRVVCNVCGLLRWGGWFDPRRVKKFFSSAQIQIFQAKIFRFRPTRS